MTSTVRVTSTDEIRNYYLLELLEYTSTIKVECLTKKTRKLSQESAEIFRAAIPKMATVFEEDLSIPYGIVSIENSKSLVSLNELVWECEEDDDELFINYSALREYIHTVISAVQRKTIGEFGSYLVFKTNDTENVYRDLHAIVLLILNFNNTCKYFNCGDIWEGDFSSRYRCVCDILSECVLIESEEEEITRLKMPVMDTTVPNLTRKKFDEYVFISVHRGLNQELNFEFTGDSIVNIKHTEGTLYGYLGYVSRNIVFDNYQPLEIFSSTFLTNISVGKRYFKPMFEHYLYSWMEFVDRSYALIFLTISYALKKENFGGTILIEDEHIPAVIRDIRTIISYIDPKKINKPPSLCLYEMLSNIALFDRSGERIKLTIPPHGSLTKKALHDD